MSQPDRSSENPKPSESVMRGDPTGAENPVLPERVEINPPGFAKEALGGNGEIETHKIRLSWVIVGATFSMFLMQFLATFYLSTHHPEAVPIVSRVFEIWVPTVIGAFGSTLGFYFSDRNRR